MKSTLLTMIVTLLLLNPLHLSAVEIGVYIIVDGNLITTNKSQEDWQTDVDRLLFEANELYDESNVDIQLVVAHTEFLSISFNSPEALLDEMSNAQNEFSHILSNADKFGADYIVTLTELDQFELCGRAITVNTSQTAITATDRAVALSDPNCGEDTFVHELGHLMGLAHGNQVASARSDNAHLQALTDYAKGWGRIVNLVTPGDSFNDEQSEAGEYGTLMVGNHILFWTGTTFDTKVPLFSSPNNAHPLCSTSSCGDAATGDAVRALNEHSLIYASHEETDADHLRYADNQLSNCLIDHYTDTEVADLNILNCTTKGITNVEGIEQLHALTAIDLSYNQLSNLAPLLDLPNNTLQSLNLTGNDAALCHQLNMLEAKYPGIVTMPEHCFNVGAFIAVLSLLN